MKKDRNTQLMLDCGSKTGRWSPEPSPDLNLYIRKYSSDAKMRFIASLKSCTTERIPPSPYAKDKDGKAVYLEYFAKDLGWALQTVRNIAAEVAADGVCRLQKGERVWFCADIPLAFQRRTKSDSNNRVHGYCPSDVADSIETEKQPKCRIFASEYDRAIAAYEEWRPTLYRDGMASLRAIDQRVKSSIDARFGIPLKTPTQKKPAKESTPASLQLELTLLVEPDFLKQTNGEENNRVHGNENGNRVHGMNGNPVHGNVSLLNSEPDKEQNNNNSGGASDEVVVVAQKLGIAPKAAGRFLTACRASVPAATLAQILEAAEAVERSIAPGKVNPTGIILNGTPAKLAAMLRIQTRRGKLEPTREQQMQACRDWIADPEASESDKEHYRKMLRGYENGHAGQAGGA